MKFWMKKALVLACVGCSLMSPAYARVHGQDHTNQTVAIQPAQDKGTVEITPAQGRGELQPGQKQDVVDLAVNMDVDGIHPKYSNRVPESWHPMDSVNWQPGQQNSPQPLKRWQVKVSDNGGTLLFSDSPEYVEENGILYSDVVDGNGRIFYYHLNNTNQNKKIAVVMENQGKYTAVVHVSRQALNQPSDNYLWVGKTAQQQFMESQENRDIFVFAGRKKLLDNGANNTIVRPGQLVNGIYDFHTDMPVRFSVIMYNPGENPLNFVSQAKVLPKDEHRLRGTYQGMNRIVRAVKEYDPLQDGAVFIPLADNQRDIYRKGIDATDGSITENYGNYGIMYELHIPVKGDSDVQYLLCPLGGVYAGAMTVKDEMQNRKFLLNVPDTKLYFGDSKVDDYTGSRFPATENRDYIYHTSELEDLGVYSGKMRISFEFSPPGASNLPVNFILMPATQAMGLAYKWQKM